MQVEHEGHRLARLVTGRHVELEPARVVAQHQAIVVVARPIVNGTDHRCDVQHGCGFPCGLQRGHGRQHSLLNRRGNIATRKARHQGQDGYQRERTVPRFHRFLRQQPLLDSFVGLRIGGLAFLPGELKHIGVDFYPIADDIGPCRLGTVVDLDLGL